MGMKRPDAEVISPSISRYVLRVWRDEAMAMAALVRMEWRSLLVMLLALLLVLSLAVAWFDPVPRQTLRMAKGQPGSGLEVMALRYRDELARHGVTLELVHSGGAIDNLRMVGQGLADVGLSQSGLQAPSGVHYLGSVSYQPLWLFHDSRASDDRDLPAFLNGKTVSVGIAGSGSHYLSERLMRELSPDDRHSLQQQYLDNPATLAALRERRIDAAFLLASMESANAQALLWMPGLSIYNFAHAKGLAHRWGFAEVVTLPAGALTISPLNPARDVQMLAVTMTLVVRHDLHPAIQQLLLSISKQLASQTQNVLDRSGQFPRFVDRGLARSPLAERFYAHGGPDLEGRLPFWLVYLVDSLLVGALALLAVAYPLSRFISNHRQLLFDAQSNHVRQELATLDSLIESDRVSECAEAITALEQAVHRMYVPLGSHGNHLQLVGAVEALKSRLPAPDNANASPSRPAEASQPPIYRPSKWTLVRGGKRPMSRPRSARWRIKRWG